MIYNIFPDMSGDIARWVCRGLNTDVNWLHDNIAFGFAVDERMVGGLIFHDYRPHQDVWWTVYACEKNWCNRRMLKEMFEIAFKRLDCKRINILVSTKNSHCLHFVERLGFKQEGVLRQFAENGDDCYILGMLRNECPWFKILTGDKK